MPGGLRRGPRWWHSKFRDCGFRITTGRDIILDVLAKADTHLSAEDIYLRVRRLYPSIGLTTVYRTLEILVNMKLVFKFDFGDGRARYELIEGPQGRRPHHHHLVCRGCGRIIDYSDALEEEKVFIETAEKKLSKKYNFDIQSHIIQFYGLCDNCRNKKQNVTPNQ